MNQKLSVGQAPPGSTGVVHSTPPDALAKPGGRDPRSMKRHKRKGRKGREEREEREEEGEKMVRKVRDRKRQGFPTSSPAFI